MKIIFINGAPRSGKDSTGEYLAQSLPGLWLTRKFATEVKARTHVAFGIFPKEDPQPEFFEDCKDEPSFHFLGTTPRKAYMQFSEGLMKPLFGDDIFGKLMLKDLEPLERGSHTKGVILTDSGFRPEAVPVIKHFGAENCTLLRLHRPGFGFENDSRGLINLDDLGVQRFDIQSPDGYLDGLYKNIRETVPFLWETQE